MGTLGEFINAGGDGFGFDAPENIDRLRAEVIIDPMSEKEIPADWSRASSTPIEGASISTLGQMQADNTQRRKVEVSALLTITNPNADVILGDRIRRGTDLWEVVEWPERDRNPFTGWNPTRVLGLKEVHG